MEETMKTCSKCGEEKTVEMFAKGRSACKACTSAQRKAHREANSEAISEAKKRCYAAKRDKYMARMKAYGAAKREVLLAQRKAHYKATLEMQRARREAYRVANREVLAEKAREYKALKPEMRKAWLIANPHISTANRAKRRAAELQRTPSWLTSEHHDQIKAIYAERDALTKATGVEHHVDHIVPLRGKNVSGLHCPWNLCVIPAAANQSKKNRYDGPDSWAA